MFSIFCNKTVSEIESLIFGHKYEVLHPTFSLFCSLRSNQFEPFEPPAANFIAETEFRTKKSENHAVIVLFMFDLL